MTTRNVVFPCGSLKLEGIFYPTAAATSCPAVVICHPHPLYGGSMRNNVTYAIAANLSTHGIGALIFNFRGVEGSEGHYGDGVAEQADVAAALDWLEKQGEVDNTRLGLVGYSFGAFVSLPVACSDPRVKGAAFISPYLDAISSTVITSCQIPRLFISGKRDNVVKPETITSYHAQNPHNSNLVLIEGADHFWSGHEREMATAVTDFLLSAFKL